MRTVETGLPLVDAALDELWAVVGSPARLHALVKQHSLARASASVEFNLLPYETRVHDGDLIVADYDLLVDGELVVGDVGGAVSGILAAATAPVEE